jgi:hypothetical protein
MAPTLDPMSDTAKRLETVKRTVEALNLVPGYPNITIEQLDSTLPWQVRIVAPHIRLSVFEEREGVTIVPIPRDGGVWMLPSPSRRVLSQGLVAWLTDKPVIPPKSRAEVRGVIRAAEANADYYFRVGMAWIMDHPAHFGKAWAERDDSDQWETIMQAFEASAKPGPMYGFMPSWRELGIPFQVMDIYDEAHIDRASVLLGSISGGER